MRNFKDAVSDIKSTLSKLIIFDTVINALLVFLVGLLIFSFFRIPYYVPAALALLYLIFVLRKRLRLNKIRIVESKYRQLNEKLRTAAEYSTAGNPVVKELHSEVLRDLNKVEESAFLNEKRIYMKSLGVVVVAFLVLLLSPFTFGFLDFGYDSEDYPSEESFDQSSGIRSGNSKIKFSVGNDDSGLRKASDDIYGEPTVAKLGDEEIKIKIRPSGTEFSIREVQESDLPDFSESYPSEVQAVGAESFEDSIPKEDLELVKNYFNQLAEG